MNNEPGLSFIPSVASAAIGCAILLFIATLCYVAWQRSGFRRNHGLLEILRLVLATLIVTTLCQPEWLRRETNHSPPTLAILWDTSDSMQTEDVEQPDKNPISRAEAIKALRDPQNWKPETGPIPLVIKAEPFSSQSEPPNQATDLNAALSKALRDHKNLAGVVVLTDGDWNAGNAPAEAAGRYRTRATPIYAVAVGSRVPLPDLQIVSLDAPTFGVVGKPLRIPIGLKSTLGQDRDVSVTLRADADMIATKVVRVPAMSQAQDTIVWTPTETGNFELALEFPSDPQETRKDNNRLTAPLTIKEEQLKVLVVESYPRWEYRYLRNALERDPGVEVTCLLFHPSLSQVGGGRSYLKEFPSANELSAFDVVFVGDVGIEKDQLTTSNIEDLRQLVSAQAAGLVFLPGRYGNQDTLVDSKLQDLLPVVLDRTRPRGVGSSQSGHFALTQAGRRSLLTQLGDATRENADVWRSLPGFHWYAATVKAKPATEVLAVHDQESNHFGRIPLIVTKTYGTGKVLFMGTDGAWRWREGVEDRYHYRFWGQVARWMAYQRQMAQGQQMRLFFTPDRPRVGDIVTLNANALDSSGGPLSAGSVIVQAISPKGKTETIRLQPGEDDEWGLFVGAFQPSQPGPHQLVATSTETAATVTTELAVQGMSRENRGSVARFDVLEELAAITGGKVTSLAEAADLLEAVAELSPPAPTMHRTRIWAHPLWGGLIVVLLGVFWTGRKMIGAI